MSSLIVEERRQHWKRPEHSLIRVSSEMGTRQKMIGRVLEQSKALTQVLGATWQSIDVFKCINNALGPLQEFTNALSGESYVNVSYLQLVLHQP